MNITTTRKDDADFYIARVGSKVGQPMWGNYTSNNAFSVESDNPERDFLKVLHLYRSGIIDKHVIGTCQPSLRKRDLLMLIGNHIVSDEVLKKMVQIDSVIRLKEQELTKFKELQSTLAKM